MLVYQLAAAIVYGPNATEAEMAPFMYNPKACRPSHVPQLAEKLGEYWESSDMPDFYMTNWALGHHDE